MIAKRFSRRTKGTQIPIGLSDKMVALTKVRATLLKSIREFFDSDGWLEVAPIPAISTLSGACEDFSTLFHLDYFGRSAFLIQTGQQHLEPFIRGPIQKVYATNQSYRAEIHTPERRLTAFLLVEAEAAHYNLSRIEDVLERLLHKLCTYVLVERAAELEILGSKIDRLKNVILPFKRLTYTEAIKILNNGGLKISWGEDLMGKHEKLLGEHIRQPFFITQYPKNIKFFNMKDDPNDSRVVLSADLLVPGLGEIAGASERENSYEQLLAKLEQFGRDKKRIKDMRRLGITNSTELKDIYAWYLDLRKYNGVPHAGFGLGFERLVQWICSFNSIIEATEYPRNKLNLAP